MNITAVAERHKPHIWIPIGLQALIAVISVLAFLGSMRERQDAQKATSIASDAAKAAKFSTMKSELASLRAAQHFQESKMVAAEGLTIDHIMEHHRESADRDGSVLTDVQERFGAQFGSHLTYDQGKTVFEAWVQLRSNTAEGGDPALNGNWVGSWTGLSIANEDGSMSPGFWGTHAEFVDGYLESQDRSLRIQLKIKTLEKAISEFAHRSVFDLEDSATVPL